MSGPSLWQRLRLSAAGSVLLAEAADEGELLERQVAAVSESYRRIAHSFRGHTDEGRCACPYCRGDVNDLAELAANYEMDLFGISQVVGSPFLNHRLIGAVRAMVEENKQLRGLVRIGIGEGWSREDLAAACHLLDVPEPDGDSLPTRRT